MIMKATMMDAAVAARLKMVTIVTMGVEHQSVIAMKFVVMDLIIHHLQVIVMIMIQ